MGKWEKTKEHILRYFAFAPLYNDELILIYQCGKVGSTSVYKSITANGRNALHCHSLKDIAEGDDKLYKLLNLKSGKILCMIRDPVAKEIAAMWQCINEVERYNIDADLEEIEKRFLSNNLADKEFRWFDVEMKQYLKIDVFKFPFDKEKGYTIIREGNIEILLMKSEMLNKLEYVIGEFLNIDQFHLYKANVGEEKSYRFAYKEYKKNLHISEKKLEEVYIKDERMRHFYTEKELQEMYKKWLTGGENEDSNNIIYIS